MYVIFKFDNRCPETPEIASQCGGYNPVPGGIIVMFNLVHMRELASSVISTLVISDRSIIKQSKHHSQAARNGC